MYDATMTLQAYACCARCGFEGPGVSTQVERADATDGAYHVFTACADVEACWAWGQAKAREQKA